MAAAPPILDRREADRLHKQRTKHRAALVGVASEQTEPVGIRLDALLQLRHTLGHGLG